MKSIQIIRTGLKQFLLCIVIICLANCSSEDNAKDSMTRFIEKQDIDKSVASWRTILKKPPLIKFSEDKDYLWELNTNKGKLTIKLMPLVAPMHVSSTIYLTNIGFYDELVFHRVIKGFMAQGGDPWGNGTGGTGYLYSGEFDVNVKHDRAGILSTANRGPDTDGSQFFITFKATPHLDGRHTIFGKVIDGMDTLKIIEDSGSFGGKTREPVVINKAKIVIK